MLELIPLFMFIVVCAALMLGYPVAFTLAGVAIWFAAFGILGGVFIPSDLLFISERLFGIYSKETLIAVPLFVFMGVMLERTKIAEELLENMGVACRNIPGGLGISVVIVGALLAASTGIVGATVVTMGLMSLPTLLKRGYSPELATGTICATGTLGQIIPPSIALVLLGDILSSAYQQAMLEKGIFDAKTISVGDLFMGAIVPGLLLVGLYIAYLFILGLKRTPAKNDNDNSKVISIIVLAKSIAPPLLLIVMVLGSIIGGAATPTEAAGVGAVAALVLAQLKGQLTVKVLAEICQTTAKISSMVFTILIGASIFSLVFIGFGGKELIENFFAQLPGGVVAAVFLVMLIIFLLGFILDFIEITFVIVPLVGPALLAMGVDPIWLGIMIALNLQTSFLTPPFGFALFYLRGVAPKSVPTSAIYRGVLPFIIIQVLLLVVLSFFPALATWLPEYVNH